MSFLEEEYQRRLSQWSDIVYALPRFYETVLRYPQCAVLELGTRGGESTSAFLAAADRVGGHVWSVEINPAQYPLPQEWYRSAVWTLIVGDDMLVPMPDRKFDVMLIDTSHQYDHTLGELRRFIPMMSAGGTVFMHDTVLKNFQGANGLAVARAPVARALDVFCAESGLSWTEHGGQYGLGEIAIPA